MERTNHNHPHTHHAGTLQADGLFDVSSASAPVNHASVSGQGVPLTQALNSPSLPTSTPSQQPSRVVQAQVLPASIASPSYRTAPRRDIFHYLAISQRRTEQTISSWIPHYLTPVERNEFRLDTRNRLGQIQIYEQQKASIAPTINPNLEQALFMARLDFRIRFFRLFRINDLPNEIICNIFRYVVWSTPDPRKGTQARLFLTWTCRNWRKLALQDPTLWNVIWFRDPPTYERSMAWFDRAGDAPKDVRINDRKDAPMAPEVMDLLLNKVFTKISSVRFIVIVVQDWDPALLVLDRLRRVGTFDIPMILQRLELHRSGSPYVQMGAGYEPSLYLNPMSLFGGASVPSLRHLSVNGIHIDWATSLLVNLTVLDIRRLPLERAPTLSQFRDLLNSSPSLRKLILDGAGPQWDRGTFQTLRPITLLHLRILVLADFSLSYGRYLLSQISTPQVRDLTLMNLIGEDYSAFYAALTGSMPEVKILTIYNAELGSGSADSNQRARKVIVKWLESMPLLVYLRIASLQKIFLDLFLDTPQTLVRNQDGKVPVVCPNLSILEWQQIDPAEVLQWTSARKTLGAPLSKMYVNQSTATTINADLHKSLTDTLTDGGDLFLLRPGHKAPEEDSLQA